MSLGGLEGRCTVYIVCCLYLMQLYSINCIIVLFFLLLIIVTLRGLLQLHHFQNLWSEYMLDLLVTRLIMLVLLKSLWQNAATFNQYKILHQLVPVYLQDMFTYSANVTGHASRNSYRLFIPRMRTTYVQKSLFYRGAVAWNNINNQNLYLLCK